MNLLDKYLNDKSSETDNVSMEHHEMGDQESPYMNVSLEGYDLVGQAVVAKDESDEDKVKMINSICHSLFVSKKKTEEGVEYNHFRLFLGPVFNLLTDFNPIMNPLLESKSIDKLEIRIASPGGLIDLGHQIINLMKNQFIGRTETVIDSTAASMASSIFLNGDVRTIYPYSTIMFHDFAFGAGGKSGVVNPVVKHVNEHIDPIFYKELVESGHMTDSEFMRMKDGFEFYFRADEICRRGIATHVMINGQLVSSEEFLARGDVPVTPPTENV